MVELTASLPALPQDAIHTAPLPETDAQGHQFLGVNVDTTQSVVEKSAVRKVAIRLVPFVALMLFINYLDRTAYFWSKDATKRGVKTWHITVPALVGGLSIPLALFAGSPAATIAVITITAMSIFAALPNFWTVPTQFLTGAAAAAGIALINTVGNLGGFSAGYITGWLKDWTGNYTV